MQNREVQNPKPNPDLVGSWIREDSFLWVVLLGGDFSRWFLKQTKEGGNFILAALLGGCVSS